MNKRNLVGSLLVSVGFFWTWGASAAPVVRSTTGTVVHGGQLTISGTGFGTKDPARPYLWAPFDGSANPSSLGVVQAWAAISNMEYNADEGFGGSGVLKATPSPPDPYRHGVWTARVDANGFAWNDWNQKVYLFRRIKRNFDVVNNTEVIGPTDGVINWKVLRIWGAGFTYPNFYYATGNGGATTEGVAGSSSYLHHLGKLDLMRGTKEVWRLDEIEYRSNSAAELSDGEFRLWVDGEAAAFLPHRTYTDRYFKLRDATSEGSRPMTMFLPVHGVKANATFPGHYRYWADDVYLDTTWARVIIGNAPTLGASSHREIQIPTAWSGDSVSVSVNIKSFPLDVTPYVFVVDAAGEVSDGFPLQRTAATLSAPVNLRGAPTH